MCSDRWKLDSSGMMDNQGSLEAEMEVIYAIHSVNLASTRHSGVQVTTQNFLPAARNGLPWNYARTKMLSDTMYRL